MHEVLLDFLRHNIPLIREWSGIYGQGRSWVLLQWWCLISWACSATETMSQTFILCTDCPFFWMHYRGRDVMKLGEVVVVENFQKRIHLGVIRFIQYSGQIPGTENCPLIDTTTTH